MVKTYNCCKEVNFPRSKGNGPESWFELKLLINYSSKLVNPLNKNKLKNEQELIYLKYCRYVWTYSSTNLVKSPSSEGTGPVRLFTPKLLLN